MRATFITLEIRSTPVRPAPDLVDAFVSELFERRDVAGPVAGFDGAALSAMVTMDAPTVAAAAVVAVAAFELSLARAGIAGVRVDEVLAYHGSPREPRVRSGGK